MKLTQKEKDALIRLLDSEHALAGLSSSYSEQDNKAFKEDYGVSMEYMKKAYKKLLSLLYI